MEKKVIALVNFMASIIGYAIVFQNTLPIEGFLNY